MSDPYMAEIRMVSFNYAPKGWALCNGQLLPISQNQALFSILGTTYGGDGRTNFALPDLRGKVPVHAGDGLVQGQKAGEPTHTLNMNELPNHMHTLNAVTTNTSNVALPNGAFLANSAPAEVFTNITSQPVVMAPSTLAAYGGSQPHNNMQPYLAVNFCIALQGIFPSRS